VCVTGIVGGKWVVKSFSPWMVPKGSYLTTYSSSSEALLETPLDEIAKSIGEGKLKLPIKTFGVKDIAEAHRFMEFEGGTKAVVLVP
jgi:NADPH:quinone reductase